MVYTNTGTEKIYLYIRIYTVRIYTVWANPTHSAHSGWAHTRTQTCTLAH